MPLALTASAAVSVSNNCMHVCAWTGTRTRKTDRTTTTRRHRTDPTHAPQSRSAWRHMINALCSMTGMLRCTLLFTLFMMLLMSYCCCCFQYHCLPVSISLSLSVSKFRVCPTVSLSLPLSSQRPPQTRRLLRSRPCILVHCSVNQHFANCPCSMLQLLRQVVYLSGFTTSMSK